MKATYIFLTICTLMFGSNQVTEAQVTAQRNGSMHEDRDLLPYSFPKIIGKDKDYMAANIEKLRPLTIIMPLPQVVSEKETKFSSVPMFVFGFAGVFVGAWIGYSIDPEILIPGEPAEIFTKSALIGAGVGLVGGTFLGYFLGKYEPK